VNKYKGLSESLLADGVCVLMNARGGSMFPLISAGDMITVRQERSYSVGEVVVFKRNGALLCHRLVKLFESGGIRCAVTRGDSLLLPDKPVPVDRILGKVVMVEKKNMSLARRILVLLYPLVCFGRLNALLVSALISCKAAATAAADPPHAP
jgi:signal peptidase I